MPAKLVLTIFLIAVGLGYLSAMVQLHFKEASPGEPLPTFADVVAHYAGAEWPIADKNPPMEDPKPEAQPVGADLEGKTGSAVKIKTLIADRCARCHSKGGDQDDHPLSTYDEIAKYLKPSPEKSLLHKLVTGPFDAWKKDISMVRAFFNKSEEWKETIAKRRETLVRAERETERLAVVAWLVAGAPKAAYESDKFDLPEEFQKRLLTEEYIAGEPKALTIQAKAPEAKKRSAKSRQVSVEGLTQSTHAHLLSFAVLWTCTGLCFAFTTYPWWLRAVVSPIVLLAQVIDIGFWWLSRLDGIGPYFALGIFLTGGIVGGGLLVQIIGSVFNMYASRGKATLLVIFLLIGGAAGVGFVSVVKPQLDAEKKEAAK